jgi:DNA-directed RNA polymerase subunit RPC12/RpoP
VPRSRASGSAGPLPERPPPEAFDPPDANGGAGAKDRRGQAAFPCGQCGAALAYAPGTEEIECRYCGHTNPIPKPPEIHVTEEDYEAGLRRLRESSPETEVERITCRSCSAAFRWTRDTHAEECPFCGAPIVVDPEKARPLQPTGLVPFRLTEPEARARLKGWLGSLWFAPGDARRLAYSEGRLSGVYIPFWTYDADTDSDYDGQRGDLHTEQYEDVDAQGRTVMRTRTYIVWTPVSGHVRRFFDDVLVLASSALPEKFTRRLRSWDLSGLVPYQEQYLAGYRSELYQTALDDGYAQARAYMEQVIYRDVCYDIGGAQQQVHRIDSRFRDITFKHVLLPVWASAYRYRGKRYQFIVNGQTGEVQGERPWSWLRIGLAVIAGLIVAGAIIWAVAASE